MLLGTGLLMQLCMIVCLMILGYNVLAYVVRDVYGWCKNHLAKREDSLQHDEWSHK